MITGCKTNKSEKSNTTVEYKKIPFSPPLDSSITIEQLQKWLGCNPRLDSLSYLYLDSFKTDDVKCHLRCQQDFINAQDTICVQQGLQGGYDEYVWILKNSGNKKNRPILDSLKLKTF